MYHLRCLTFICFFSLIRITACAGLDITDDSLSRAHYIDSLQKVIASEPPDTALFKAYYDLANIYARSVPSLSFKYCDKAIELAGKLGNNRKLSDVYSIKGMLLKNEGKYEQAIRLHLEALKLKEELNDGLGLAICYNDIGVLYKTMGNFDKAVYYYQKALAKCRELKYDKGIAMCLNNIGTIYNELGREEEAMHYYKQSLEKSREIKNNAAEANALNNIGELYFKEKKFEEALLYFLQTLELDKQTGDMYGNALTLTNIGNCYRDLKRFESAAQAYKEALTVAAGIGAKYEMSMIYLSMSAMDKQNDNYESALKNYKLYMSYKDSILTEENSRQIADLQTKYETEKKEQEIQLLTKDKQINAIDINKKQSTIYISLSGFIIAALLLTVIFGMYRQKQTANLRLQKLDREKNEFLGIAAHDLKNPLQTIIGYCQMQLDYFEKLNKEKILKYTKNMELSARRMVELISNLLDINAIEEGRINSSPENFDMKEQLIRIMQNFDYATGQKNIRLHLEADGFLSYPLYADIYMFTQVFENLLSNAIKYSPFDKEIFIRLRNDELKHTAGFSITDQGPGMTTADLQKLFQKFTRLSARPTGGESSNGLGLSIVKKLTDLMGGQISCSSEHGKGCTFTVIIPAKATHTA